MERYEKAVAIWKQKRITNDAELAEALNGHSIAFAYHSGKLENEQITYHDTREIFEHDGVTSYTGDLRTLFEIRNAKDANELLLTAFNERRPLNESLVKEFQFRLTQNTYDTRRWQLGERPGESGHEGIASLPVEVRHQGCLHRPPGIDGPEAPDVQPLHLFGGSLAERCRCENPDVMPRLELGLGDVPDHLFRAAPVVKGESSEHMGDSHRRPPLHRVLAESQENLKRPYA